MICSLEVPDTLLPQCQRMCRQIQTGMEQEGPVLSCANLLAEITTNHYINQIYNCSRFPFILMRLSKCVPLGAQQKQCWGLIKSHYTMGFIVNRPVFMLLTFSERLDLMRVRSLQMQVGSKGTPTLRSFIIFSPAATREKEDNI